MRSSTVADLETRDGELVVNIDGKIHEVIRGWESFGGQYWFAVEIDRVQDSAFPDGRTVEDDPIYFGLVQGQYEELGYFAESQLQPMIDQGKVWEIPEANLPHAGRRT